MRLEHVLQIFSLYTNSKHCTKQNGVLLFALIAATIQQTFLCCLEVLTSSRVCRVSLQLSLCEILTRADQYLEDLTCRNKYLKEQVELFSPFGRNSFSVHKIYFKTTTEPQIIPCSCFADFRNLTSRKIFYLYILKGNVLISFICEKTRGLI